MIWWLLKIRRVSLTILCEQKSLDRLCKADLSAGEPDSCLFFSDDLLARKGLLLANTPSNYTQATLFPKYSHACVMRRLITCVGQGHPFDVSES